MYWLISICLCSYLCARSLEERARHAETLLGEYCWQEALDEYTAILEELPLNDKESLEFAYWIHRERGYAAFLLDDLSTTFQDIEGMRSVLDRLGYVNANMDEYHNLLREVQQFKEHKRAFAYPTLSLGSWWGKATASYSEAKYKLDKFYYRATNQRWEIERLEAEKRAKELYYPGLVHSQAIMEKFSTDIEARDMALGRELSDFLYKNRLYLGVAGAAAVSTIILSGPAGMRQIVGTAVALGAQGGSVVMYIQKEAPQLWQQYTALRSEENKLSRMEKENEKASYTRCLEEGRIPKVRFASENDTAYRNTYFIMSADNQRYEFSFSIDRRF